MKETVIDTSSNVNGVVATVGIDVRVSDAVTELETVLSFTVINRRGCC